MPTVKQLQRKLKKQVSTKYIMRTLRITSRRRSNVKETYEKEVEVPDEIWDNPPEVLKIREEDVNRRAWIARTPSTYEAKIYKLRMNEDNDKRPQADLLVTDRRSERGAGSYKTVFLDELILHPSELTEDRLAEYYTVEDKRKS